MVAHGSIALPRESPGRMRLTFSSGAIETRTRHFLASLSTSRERDKERDGVRVAIQKETPGSTTASVVLTTRSEAMPKTRSFPCIALRGRWDELADLGRICPHDLRASYHVAGQLSHPRLGLPHPRRPATPSTEPWRRRPLRARRAARAWHTTIISPSRPPPATVCGRGKWT